MTVCEFEQKNADILVRRMTDADFQQLSDGCVFFMITVANGATPLEKRQVRTAGYQMVAAHFHGSCAAVEKVCTLALTANGYAKINDILRQDLQENGTKLLYICKPLPQHDPRKGHHWLINN